MDHEENSQSLELQMRGAILSEFQDNCDRLFVKPTDKIGRILHAAIGIAGESGEILDTVKKSWIYGQELDAKNILEECGDVLFFVSVLLAEVGYEMETAMVANQTKLKKRYPNGYTDSDASTRADKPADY